MMLKSRPHTDLYRIPQRTVFRGGSSLSADTEELEHTTHASIFPTADRDLHKNMLNCICLTALGNNRLELMIMQCRCAVI